MNSLNSKIFDYLVKSDITKNELARRINTSKQNIYALSKADDMKLSQYLSICDALKLPYDYFLGETTNNISVVNDKQENYGSEKTALSVIIEQLTVKDVQISELIKALGRRD